MRFGSGGSYEHQGSPDSVQHHHVRLGVAPPDQSVAFDIPPREAECARGLRFFLVVFEQKRGYWAGPVRPRWGSAIQLVIEKYAGLSTAELLGN